MRYPTDRQKKSEKETKFNSYRTLSALLLLLTYTRLSFLICQNYRSYITSLYTTGDAVTWPRLLQTFQNFNAKRKLFLCLLHIEWTTKYVLYGII